MSDDDCQSAEFAQATKRQSSTGMHQFVALNDNHRQAVKNATSEDLGSSEQSWRFKSSLAHQLSNTGDSRFFHSRASARKGNAGVTRHWCPGYYRIFNQRKNIRQAAGVYFRQLTTLVDQAEKSKRTMSFWVQRDTVGEPVSIRGKGHGDCCVLCKLSSGTV